MTQTRKHWTESEKAKALSTVFEQMHNGIVMYKACKAIDVAPGNFMRWVEESDDLKEKYARARDSLVEKVADDMLEIADCPVGSTDSGATDSGAVNKQRLQVDTRKWLLSKIAPRKYGDAVKHEITGEGGGPLKVSVEFVGNKAP